MSKFGNPFQRALLYRESYEWNSAIGWFFVVFVLVGVLSSSWAGFSNEGRCVYALIVGLAATFMTRDFILAYPVLKAQARMFTSGLLLVTALEIRLRNGVAKGKLHPGNNPKLETYMGEGFEWGTEHTNMAHKLKSMDTKRSQIVMPFPVRWYVEHHKDKTRELGGQPWIINLDEQREFKVAASNWYGHTLITGNVGTGKTTLLRLLSSAAIHRGNSVIAIDPKNDIDWRDSMRAECEAFGIPFYSFHPSNASISVAIDLLANYTRLTELPSRIVSGMTKGGKTDNFSDFAYDSIYKICLMCQFLGEKITLVRINDYLFGNRLSLFNRVLERYYDELIPDWRKSLMHHIDAMGGGIEGMFTYYETTMINTHQSTAVDAAVAAFRHPFEHYQKMLTSLRPHMLKLTAAPLDDLLSAIHDPNSDREIINLRSMIDNGGVIHIGLDSQSDSQTADTLVKLLISDIAAISGSRYNNGEGLAGSTRVSLYVDEAHAAICDELLALLAQSRASKFECTIVTQTISDFAAKVSEAVANRVIGLCNNWISTRVNDPLTQQNLAQKFGLREIESRDVTISEGADTGAEIMFSGGVSQKLGTKEVAGFPPDLLSEIPVGQAVCSLADGRKAMVRIPVILREGA